VTRYGQIEPIAPDHDTHSFDCGSQEQTGWLVRHALQAHQSDTAKVYVVCLEGSRSVAGYYALAAGAVEHAAAPPKLTKGIGRYPVPVVILTRLGVDLAQQGRGLGSALVRDALFQVASIAERVGVRALLIHAATPEAAAFYRSIDPGFEPSPTDPLHVILLIKDLRRAIRDASAVGRASVVDDRDDELVFRPLPMDPIAAARGSLRGQTDEPSSDEARRRTRREEAASDPTRGATR
jgi:GNAT superfamily N-acetyltransferase